MPKLQSQQAKPSLFASSRRLRGLLLAAAVVLLAFILIRLYSAHTKPSSLPQRESSSDAAAELPSSPPAPPPLDLNRLRTIHATTLASLPASDIPGSLQAAEAARRIGDLFTAERLLRNALKQTPQNIPTRRMLAELLRQTCRFAQARSLYLALHTEQPHDLEPFLGLAEVASSEGRQEEIFVWLAKAREEMSPTVENLIDLAHHYQDWSDFATAKATVAEALRLAPGDENAMLQQASILVEHNEMEEAYPLLETLLAHRPNNGYACRLLAVVLTTPTSSHQDFDRARTLLEKAADINKDDMTIYRVAAIIYRQKHLYRLAAQCYDALLHLNPRDQEGRYGLGQVYALLGQADWSKEQLVIYAQLQAETRPLPALDAAIRANPTASTRHQAKARFLEAQGDMTAALAEYQTAALLASGSERARAMAAVQKLYARLGWPPLPKETL